jgi:methylated-DNA-[protein]-cysteine S-methyltransferase
MEPGFTLFDTSIGACGIAWGERGITAVQLPEADATKTRARLLRRSPRLREGLPPPAVQRAIDSIVALLRGVAADLSGVVLDMDRVEPFERQVYEIARTIAPGATLSYGEIAVRLGDAALASEASGQRGHSISARAGHSPEPGSSARALLARDVGQALGRNPFPLIVPCHRVLAAGGKVGGFSANGGITTKLRLLTIERARTSDAPTLFDGDDAFGLAVKPRARSAR